MVLVFKPNFIAVDMINWQKNK